MHERWAGTILVTGASTGIGRFAAKVLAKRGYTVLAGVRTRAAQVELSSWDAGPGRIQVCHLDITCEEQIDAAVHLAEKTVSPEVPFFLLNNAGITVPGPIEFVALEDLRKAFEVNLIGQLAMVQAFLPLIRRSRGRIVQVSSAMGRLAMPLSGPYAASKYALEGLMDSLRRELHRSGVKVCLLEPGSVRSAIWRKIDAQADDIERRLPAEARQRYEGVAKVMSVLWKKAEAEAVSPAAVARALVHALESRSPKARYPVGTDARLIALMSVFLPGRALDYFLQKFCERFREGACGR